MVSTPSQKLSAGKRNEYTGGHTKRDALKLIQVADEMTRLAPSTMHDVWMVSPIKIFNFTGTTTTTDALPSIYFPFLLDFCIIFAHPFRKKEIFFVTHDL